MKPALCWLAHAFLLVFALANTEKTIFLGSSAVNISTTPLTLDSLGLNVLAPDVPSLRTKVDASFPNDITPQGTATWLLLYNLTTAQRYELRVCWAATQPTTFLLETFELNHVFETPELVSSLAVYAERHRLTESGREGERTGPVHRLLSPAESKSESRGSVMFLRILAAADYYSDDFERMANVKPVLVDIILDPYSSNIIPGSLAYTATYVVAVAILAGFISQITRRWIRQASSSFEADAKKMD